VYIKCCDWLTFPVLVYLSHNALTLYTYKLVKRTFTTGSYVQLIIIMDVTDVTRFWNQEAHLLHTKDHQAHILCKETQSLVNITTIQGLSRKYTAIFNISRTGRVALMKPGSQSEKTFLRIREQSFSRGASQSLVGRRWRSLCTVWPSDSQCPSKQISESASSFASNLDIRPWKLFQWLRRLSGMIQWVKIT
jgi:hypothetical protein